MGQLAIGPTPSPSPDETGFVAQLFRLLNTMQGGAEPDAGDLVQPLPMPGPGALPSMLPPLIGGVGRRFGKAGSRIAKGAQSFTEGFDKIPRFRSELGTFIKHNGKWWRMQPFGAEDQHVTLEWLGEMTDDFTGEVLKRKNVSMKDMVENAKNYNAASTAGREAAKVARRKK